MWYCYSWDKGRVYLETMLSMTHLTFTMGSSCQDNMSSSVFHFCLVSSSRVILKIKVNNSIIVYNMSFQIQSDFLMVLD